MLWICRRDDWQDRSVNTSSTLQLFFAVCVYAFFYVNVCYFWLLQQHSLCSNTVSFAVCETLGA